MATRIGNVEPVSLTQTADSPRVDRLQFEPDTDRAHYTSSSPAVQRHNDDVVSPLLSSPLLSSPLLPWSRDLPNPRTIRRLLAVWAVFAGLALSACHDYSPTETGDAPRSSAAEPEHAITQQARDLVEAAARGDNSRAFESDLLRVEAAVPGFGGLYFDSDQERVVAFVKDPTESRVQQVRAAVGALIAQKPIFTADGRVLSNPLVEVQSGDYAFSELVAWTVALLPRLMTIPEWTLVDANERINRISVGVEAESGRPAVEAAVLALGVPSEAVRIEQRFPPTLAVTLRDHERPASGGLQLVNGGVVPRVCTYGWTVQWGGIFGFLTVSHCQSSEEGKGITEETFHQNTQSAANAIGQVYENPAWPANVPGCEDEFGNPWFAECPWADAMWIEAYSSFDIQFRVAIPTQLQHSTNEPGGIVIGNYSDVHPTETGGDGVGSFALKVGRTTGYTGGQVTDTCSPRRFQKRDGTRFVMPCVNTLMGSSVGEGDSGGPVFKATWTGEAIPLGMVVGGRPFNT